MTSKGSATPGPFHSAWLIAHTHMQASWRKEVEIVNVFSKNRILATVLYGTETLEDKINVKILFPRKIMTAVAFL